MRGAERTMMDRLTKIGNVRAMSAKEVDTSRLGIGFEKLDRAVFDPEKAYEPLAKIGVKYVRIQSGWQRTERIKGIYDFAWLDAIVDRLRSDGMIPWMNIVYGNEIYDERAAEAYGAVGCPPLFSDEAFNAWIAYVRALVVHFRGRVRDYEIWNEPDGRGTWKCGANPVDYARLAIPTAKAIHESDPDARALIGAMCRANMVFFAGLAEEGAFDICDALTYHCYTPSDKVMADSIRSMRALCDYYKPGMPVIQGESGTQSRSGGNGALKQGVWSERRQAKYMARHLIIDLLGGAEFASYFSCMDMIEALNGKNGDKASWLDYGYFGVLGAEFDENGFAIGDYKPKMSYRTLQVLASVLSGEWKVQDLPIMPRPDVSKRIFGTDVNDFETLGGGFLRPDGSRAYVYWHASDLMTSEYESTVTLHAAGVPGAVKLVDMLDGSIYSLPESIAEPHGDGRWIFHNLPIKDYPMMLTFGNFLRE